MILSPKELNRISNKDSKSAYEIAANIMKGIMVAAQHGKKKAWFFISQADKYEEVKDIFTSRGYTFETYGKKEYICWKEVI